MNLEIQKLRGLAITLVLLFHFNVLFPNGFIGVDIFFVISGYLMTKTLLKNDNLDKNTIKIYYISRISRLYPSFIFFVLIAQLIILLFYSPNLGSQQNALKALIGVILLIANYVNPYISGQYFGALTSDNPFIHIWSLSLEIQFYFIYPLLIIVILKLFGSKFKIILFCLGIISYFYLIISLTFESAPVIFDSYYSLVSRIWEFVVGGLVFFLPKIKISSNIYRIFSLIYFITIILFANLYLVDAKENLQLLVFPVILTSIVIYLSESMSCNKNNEGTIFFVDKFFIHMGQISYSLYLWHWFIFVTIQQIIILPKNNSIILSIFISYAAAILSYNYIEQKVNITFFENLKNWLKVFFYGQVILLLILIVLILGSRIGWNRNWALNSHLIVQKNCDGGIINLEKCSWNVKNNQQNIILVGDSMAWAIGNSIIKISEEMNYSIYAFVKNSCPIALPNLNSDSDCDEWRKVVINKIKELDPKYIFMTNNSTYNFEQNYMTKLLIEYFLSNNMKIIYISAPVGGDTYSGRRSLVMNHSKKDRFKEIDLAETKVNQFNLIDSNFKFLNPNEILCLNEICKISINRQELFTYGNHLSPYANEILKPWIKYQLIFNFESSN